MTSVEIFLAIVSILSFIGALPQVWGESWRDIWAYRKNGIIPWGDITDAYLRILEKMKSESFLPTTIIGIGRGGMVAAGLVCSGLVNQKLVSNIEKQNVEETPKIKIGTINTTIYYRPVFSEIDQTGPKTEIEKITYSEPEVTLDENDKVLLVIAQTFSGESFDKAMAILTAKGISRKNVRTATILLHELPNLYLVHTPDYIGMRTTIKKTVPWKNNRISTDRY
jgi:hypoxanthine phosphoribosyltransferase